jgi:hypothetical protein
MFELKPDYDQVLKRFEDWWDCAVIDHPPVGMTFAQPANKQVPWPARKTHTTLRERWLDTEYNLTGQIAHMRNTVHYADALPIAWPNLGPEIFSAFYGCDMEYGESTAWSKPVIHDWTPAVVEKLKLDTNCFFYKKIMEMTDAYIQAGRDKFIVGYTDLHGGADAIAAFRDPQALCIDMVERPQEVKALGDRITRDFLRVYDEFHAKLSAAGMPSTSWLPAICRGKYHIPSCDFSCMISDDMFAENFLPGIVEECRHMDRSIYHLDGPQALRYLDTLLDVPQIHAIQWVPGAGRDHWADQVPVFKRIQERKKAFIIAGLPATDLPQLFSALRPEGVWIGNVSGITNQAEADAALKAIGRWGK